MSADVDSKVTQFCAVTGATAEVATTLLEACAGNLEMAIDMHLDCNTGEGSGSTAAAAADAAPSPALNDSDGEGVRAPIPQKTEVLVEDVPVYGWRNRRRAANSVFDGFRDFQAEARQQEQAGTSGATKRRTLEDLFRPPIELMHKGSLTSARESASGANRWLLVNVQNVKEFACQVLNRDVWSNPRIKALIKESFVLFQVYHDSEEGKKFVQFYKVEEFPYISIVDPITGENMSSWTSIDAKSFHQLLIEFLALHPTPDGSTSSESATPSKKQRNSIVDASEDSQLEAAMKASMQETCTKRNLAFESDSDYNLSEDDDDLETFTDSEDGDNVKISRRQCDKQDSSGSKAGPPDEEVDQLQQACDIEKLAAGVQKELESDSSTANGHTHSSTSGSKRSRESDSSTNSDELIQKKKCVEGSWKSHLGEKEDPETNLLLRFPNGHRQPFRIPCSSSLQAVVLYAEEQGFPPDKFELMTSFPRRKLSQLPMDQTLKEAGLHPQETVFIHER